MAAIQNYTWIQGEDLLMTLIYKVGETPETATPVDLTGYSLRMDVASQGASPTRLYTLNSDELVDPADTTTEATLLADGTINIAIPRSVTLPGGELYEALSSGLVFDYDLFLRDTSNKQKKVIGGTITVAKSITHWE